MKALCLLLFYLTAVLANAADQPLPERDAQGRRVIVGPIRLGFGEHLSNVHILSNGYGIKAEMNAWLSNSVIEAPICVTTKGLGLKLTSNDFYCDLAIEFTGTALMDNQFIDNRYSGQYTNRPDAFGN